MIFFFFLRTKVDAVGFSKIFCYLLIILFNFFFFDEPSTNISYLNGKYLRKKNFIKNIRLAFKNSSIYQSETVCMKYIIYHFQHSIKYTLNNIFFNET